MRTSAATIGQSREIANYKIFGLIFLFLEENTTNIQLIIL